MLIFKIVGIGVTGALLSLLLKQYKPEIAIAVPILAAAFIITMCAPYLKSVLAMFEDIANGAGIELSHMRIVIKITGTAYICQFAADICKDAGENAIAGKIELGGKIVIITLSVPVIYNLLELVNNIINF
ncbi:MAG: stage III sporulation protein AD [Clostridia bacterium]|nr:stage III sporulation protein AD [Clostridia bacterium]